MSFLIGDRVRIVDGGFKGRVAIVRRVIPPGSRGYGNNRYTETRFHYEIFPELLFGIDKKARDRTITVPENYIVALAKESNIERG